METRHSGASKSWLMGLIGLAIGVGGCGANRLAGDIDRAMAVGEYGVARVKLQGEISTRLKDRNYILSRERYLIAALADGYPQLAEETANDVFDLLSLQGLNEDRTVAAVVFHEGVKTWKGEPFEQAMAYSYVAIQKASLGDWDNARVAASESLFMLKDFGENEMGGRKTTEDIARAAYFAEHEQGQTEDAYFDSGYQPIETNFTLGYLLTGLSSRMIGREEEARDNFAKAVRYNRALEPVTDRLLADESYNVVLIVDAGPGPEKIRYGPDNALARFIPRHPSDGARLEVYINGQSEGAVPVACDVNLLAQDHMWNNMEDVRVAKSRIGNALVVAGATTATIGAASDSDAAAIAGLAMLMAGMISKASAAADLTHAELLPQRVYMVPVLIEEPDSIVEVVVGGAGWTWGITLPGIDPPDSYERAVLRYVRLPEAPPAWTSLGTPRYANDEFEGPVPGDELPYILGGRCVRVPARSSLAHYQRRGFLLDLTVEDLRNIYRDEGLWWDPAELPAGADALHVLEGGRSLLCPQPGTVGYTRLFATEHAPFRPRSVLARDLHKAYAPRLVEQSYGASAN